MHNVNLNRAAAIVALMALGACNSLEVNNPIDPDADRALADPAALEALAGGSLRTWGRMWSGMENGGVLTTQAQSFSSSWNNFNMNFYSSVDNPSAPPAQWNRSSRAWQNDPSAAGRTSIEYQWTGSYSALSSANDVIKAIKGGAVINNASDTKRAETIATLVQGLTLSVLAINYDKAYIVEETTDLNTLEYSDRKKVRDAAVTKLLAAATLAKANSFSTPGGWTNGTSYNSGQIARVANTMAAATLALWPRNAAENGQVNWANVVTYASQGMSSGAPFDLIFTGDGCPAGGSALTDFCPELLIWFDGIDGGRVHTRVANMIDPVTQRHPWPLSGNPPPNSADKRLGDGSFGDESIADAFGTIPKTANGGTDFAWSGVAPFRPDRGSYHQSNIGHMRYDESGNQDPTAIYGGFGPYPILSATFNDLLWAEGLIRSSGSLGTAATLLNKTRVTRGGLSAATAGEGAPSLLTKLYYEQEIELMGISALPFFNRRRIDGLITGTPREMPVPARELGVLGQPLYTWGGTNPPNSPTPP
ncbi:MAG: hypothetical protein ACT4P6_06325 [Gemmatimonadaceae bacterium]